MASFFLRVLPFLINSQPTPNGRQLVITEFEFAIPTTANNNNAAKVLRIYGDEYF